MKDMTCFRHVKPGKHCLPMRRPSVVTLCIFNLVATLVALFFVFRPWLMPREKPVEEIITQPVPASEASLPPDEAWEKFLKSRDVGEASSFLSMLPQTAGTGSRLAEYVKNTLAPFPQVRWGRTYIDRIAAAIGAWEPWLDYGGDDSLFLEQVAANRVMPVLIRDCALRAVIGAAHRKKLIHADARESDWQTHLTAFLTGTGFGDDTSIGGLAVQAALFVTNEKIVSVEPAFFERRIQAVLGNRDDVNESTLCAVLDAAAQLDMPEVAGAIREIVKKPSSEAVQLAGLRALSRNGDYGDVVWLETVPAPTPAVHRALLDTQKNLQEKSGRKSVSR
ncbi:hypothetical protein OpiT1DRAFT_05911 [Opitutaceae bacterium TAV1]|nr:hypothetical protein OpiT1DRAFT_05911 [Opitutaceae bacterium TAV1]